jgi:uncharacterized damage-inducible protein DinB
MRTRDVLTLYDYNYWANSLLLGAAARLTTEQFAAPASFPFGGVRGTLVHTLDAEFSWRVLLEKAGKDFKEFSVAALDYTELKESDFASLTDLQKLWQVEQQRMRAYLATLNDDLLDRTVRYVGDTGIRRERLLWHCLVHVVNHGTQHRSEAAALLTDFGQSPGDVDFTVFLNDRK